jgi:hypothetical protein
MCTTILGCLSNIILYYIILYYIILYYIILYYINTRAILHPRYSTPSYYTKQNSVLFSTRVSVLFSIFEVLGVVLTDTEHGSIVLSIFSGQF